MIGRLRRGTARDRRRTRFECRRINVQLVGRVLVDQRLISDGLLRCGSYNRRCWLSDIGRVGCGRRLRCRRWLRCRRLRCRRWSWCRRRWRRHGGRFDTRLDDHRDGRNRAARALPHLTRVRRTGGRHRLVRRSLGLARLPHDAGVGWSRIATRNVAGGVSRGSAPLLRSSPGDEIGHHCLLEVAA